MDDRDEQLLDEIVQYLNEPAVRPKVRKAIEDHGEQRVREEFGEMRTQLLTRAATNDPIRNPPGYLLNLLKMLNAGPAKPHIPKANNVFFDSLEDHLNSTIEKAITKEDLVVFNGAMSSPYSTQGIPWPTALGRGARDIDGGGQPGH